MRSNVTIVFSDSIAQDADDVEIINSPGGISLAYTDGHILFLPYTSLRCLEIDPISKEDVEGV